MITTLRLAKNRFVKTQLGKYAKWDNAAVLLIWAVAVTTTIILAGKNRAIPGK
jgi:hypothetical protein